MRLRTGRACQLQPFVVRSVVPQKYCRALRCQAHSSAKQKRGFKVMALDAAQPYDFEHKISRSLKQQKALHIAIIGFGKFGQFLARRLVAAGHQITATSKRDYSEEAKSIGVTFYPDADDLCEAHPDVVIIATSIMSTQDVVKALPVQRLRRSTLIVDVLSVKSFPKKIMVSKLPEEMDILCTHPMFGPDSGSGSWAGLNFMYEKVRIGKGQQRQKRVDTFLKFFQDEGCKMVEMSCEQHDSLAAETQFTTHFVGRTLGHMGLKETPIDTTGYQALLKLIQNTNNDSFDLFYGLFMYNENAVEIVNRLEDSFKFVRQQLMTKLHEKAKEQMFGGISEEAVSSVISKTNTAVTKTMELQNGSMSPLQNGAGKRPSITE